MCLKGTSNLDGLAKMTDEDALAKGVTDVTEAIAQGRPTWRQSEIDAADMFPDNNNQISFKMVDGELTEVPYGTSGSVRPDYYKPGHVVDVKNYKVTTSTGRSNLARNIEKQYNQRKVMFPEGTKYSVLIDVRGQDVTHELLQQLEQNILTRTNNGMEVLFKTDF